MGFKRIIIGIIIVISFPSLSYPQVDIEKATREVDRLKRQELEEKLKVVPKAPEIKKEEEEKKRVLSFL